MSIINISLLDWVAKRINLRQPLSVDQLFELPTPHVKLTTSFPTCTVGEQKHMVQENFLNWHVISSFNTGKLFTRGLFKCNTCRVTHYTTD